MDAHLKVIAFPITLDSIVVGQLHHKVVVFLSIAYHGLAPLSIIRTAG